MQRAKGWDRLGFCLVQVATLLTAHGPWIDSPTGDEALAESRGIRRPTKTQQGRCYGVVWACGRSFLVPE